MKPRPKGRDRPIGAWRHGVPVCVLTTTGAKSRETADADERAALWPRLVDFYADYANYQSWTDREIPVVICDPTPEEASS